MATAAGALFFWSEGGGDGEEAGRNRACSQTDLEPQKRVFLLVRCSYGGESLNPVGVGEPEHPGH